MEKNLPIGSGVVEAACKTLATERMKRSGMRWRLMGAALEELISEESKPGKRGPAPKLQHQIERMQELPKPKQRFVMEMLETVLAQESR